MRTKFDQDFADLHGHFPGRVRPFQRHEYPVEIVHTVPAPRRAPIDLNRMLFGAGLLIAGLSGVALFGLVLAALAFAIWMLLTTGFTG